MRPDIKQQWLDALKSGEYHHGKRFLKKPAKDDTPVRHCVLGVLCELHFRAFPETQGWDAPIGDSLITYEGLRSSLSTDVMTWAGLKDYLPRYVSTDGLKIYLSSDNDDNNDYQAAIHAIEVYF